jgi:hypothetical protein
MFDSNQPAITQNTAKSIAKYHLISMYPNEDLHDISFLTSWWESMNRIYRVTISFSRRSGFLGWPKFKALQFEIDQDSGQINKISDYHI